MAGRVALHLPNIPEFIICYLGIIRTGAIAVSINPSPPESGGAGSSGVLLFSVEDGDDLS